VRKSFPGEGCFKNVVKHDQRPENMLSGICSLHLAGGFKCLIQPNVLLVKSTQ